MSQIEEAYLLGQQQYEMLLLQKLAAAQQSELEQAALMEHAAGAEAHLLQQGYLAGMADYEAALAAAVASSPPASREALEQEEAYQMGVSMTEAQNLVRQIEKSAGELSGDLKKAFEKGREDVRVALEGAKEAQEPSKSKRGR